MLFGDSLLLFNVDCRVSAVVFWLSIVGRSLLLIDDYCVSGLVVFFIVGRRCPSL
jgi:hypothetical protein